MLPDDKTSMNAACTTPPTPAFLQSLSAAAVRCSEAAACQFGQAMLAAVC